MGALTGLSYREDARDDKLQERLAESEKLAEKARRLAVENGVPPAGGPAVFTTAKHYRAKELWKTHCESCHVGQDRQGPEIVAGYNSRAWIRAFLENPSGDRFFGLTDIDEMSPVELEGDDLDAIVELINAQTGAEDADEELVSRGQTLFDDGDCWQCHSIDYDTEGDVGPNLGKRGSVDMLAAFIGNAGHARWFGDKNEMPRFDRKLSQADLRALAEYVASLRTAEPAPEE